MVRKVLHQTKWIELFEVEELVYRVWQLSLKLYISHVQLWLSFWDFIISADVRNSGETLSLMIY